VFEDSCGDVQIVGVLRLRGKCAARNFHFAQDDRLRGLGREIEAACFPRYEVKISSIILSATRIAHSAVRVESKDPYGLVAPSVRGIFFHLA
jgi:hypothetical protein